MELQAQRPLSPYIAIEVFKKIPVVGLLAVAALGAFLWLVPHEDGGKPGKSISSFIPSLFKEKQQQQPFENPNHPDGTFGLPVGHPIVLSGTFGELRPDHFHGGLDIKPISRGLEGEPLLAIADGYISHIRVMPKGFGNAVYVTYPEYGYTCIYAHLSGFTDDVKSYLRGVQELARKVPQDIDFSERFFPVKRGETVGFMGNTGSSRGAHLHFEVRRASDGTNINPLFLGYNIQDNKPPLLTVLRAYTLDANGTELKAETMPILRGKDGSYTLKNPVVKVDGSHFGFALGAHDNSDDADNQLGIYGLELSVDDTVRFSFKLDAVHYDSTRFINAHMDFMQARSGRRMHRCFRLSGNRLPIYTEGESLRGIVAVAQGQTRNVRLRAFDFYGNSTAINFLVGRSEAVATAPSKTYNLMVPHLGTKTIENKEFKAEFPFGTFYEDAYLSYGSTAAPADVYSLGHGVFAESTPVHGYYTVKIHCTGIPEHLKAKALVVELNSGSAQGGEWEGDWMVAKVKRLGRFGIKADVTGPALTLLNKPASKKDKTPVAKGRIAFRISDGLSGVERWEAWLNGQWLTLDYDGKSNLLAGPIEKISIPEGGLTDLLLIAKDAKGNETRWEGKIMVSEQ